MQSRYEQVFLIIALLFVACHTQLFGQLQLPPEMIITREQWAEVRKNHPDADSSILKSLAKRVEFLQDTIVLLTPSQMTFSALDSALWHSVDSLFARRLQFMPPPEEESFRFDFIESFKAGVIVSIMKYEIDKEPPVLLDSWIDICPVEGPGHSRFWGPPPIDKETGQIIFPTP